MERREFIKTAGSSLAVGLTSSVATEIIATTTRPQNDMHIKDQLYKVSHFNQNFADDFLLPEKYLDVMVTTYHRINRIKRYVGYGHFNLITFDEMIRYSRRNHSIGNFTRNEQRFLDMIFHENAYEYGFYGKKVLSQMTHQIIKRKVVKIPRSGHYIYRGEAEKLFSRLRKDVGSDLILTSGIRGIVKQFHLFLAKAIKTGGNFSRASRSIAPPGYSYHGIGDFDVGKRGFGHRNFSSEFANTEEFKKLIELGYISIRYTSQNKFGVRFEPWHIKVT